MHLFRLNRWFCMCLPGNLFSALLVWSGVCIGLGTRQKRCAAGACGAAGFGRSVGLNEAERSQHDVKRDEFRGDTGVAGAFFSISGLRYNN